MPLCFTTPRSGNARAAACPLPPSANSNLPYPAEGSPSAGASPTDTQAELQIIFKKFLVLPEF